LTTIDHYFISFRQNNNLDEIKVKVKEDIRNEEEELGLTNTWSD